MEAAARKDLWDPSLGLFVSGPNREVSWASQAWMVLAGVPSPEQAKRAMSAVMRHAGRRETGGALYVSLRGRGVTGGGPEAAATDLFRSYWGGMGKKVADTFWEVYVPGDDFCRPTRATS